jgi:hypothetical protein
MLTTTPCMEQYVVKVDIVPEDRNSEPVALELTKPLLNKQPRSDSHGVTTNFKNMRVQKIPLV